MVPICECVCHVSLGLKEAQMGTRDFKSYKVPLFARKPVNIDVSRSASPKLAFCASKPL